MCGKGIRRSWSSSRESGIRGQRGIGCRTSECAQAGENNSVEMDKSVARVGKRPLSSMVMWQSCSAHGRIAEYLEQTEMATETTDVREADIQIPHRGRLGHYENEVVDSAIAEHDSTGASFVE